MFHTDILLPESELCAPCLLHIDSTLYLNECWEFNEKNGCFTLSKDLDYNCDVLILAFILWHEHKTQKLMKTKRASSYYTSTSMQPLWENSAETQFLEITFINYNTCLRTGSKQIYLLLKCDACSTILLLFVRAVQVHLWVRLHILPFQYY